MYFSFSAKIAVSAIMSTRLLFQPVTQSRKAAISIYILQIFCKQITDAGAKMFTWDGLEMSSSRQICLK